jgi:hypothetical protein
VGKLTQVKLTQPDVTADRKSTPGKRSIPCPKPEVSTDPVATGCTEDVTVAYLDHVGTITVHFAGSVRAVDARTGEQVFTQSFDLQTDDQTHWADTFHIDHDEVDPATVGVNTDIVALATARRQLAAPSELAKAALDKVGERSVAPLLAVIDAEAAWTDPAALTVVAMP